MDKHQISVYTDGSCHTKLKIGVWAAILFIDQEKITINGIVKNTTHNSMELKAVTEAINYLVKGNYQFKGINIYTDSQLIERIPLRKEKLKKNNFQTKKNTAIQNIELVKTLIHQIDSMPITLIKVKAHQKTNGKENYNREVDKLVRKLLRNNIINSSHL